MTRIRRCAVAVAAAGVLALGACSSDGDSSDSGGSTSTATTSAAPSSAASAALPAEVTKVVGALDDLEAEHSEPVEGNPLASGADKTFDLSIVDYDASIHLFSSANKLETWQSASDDFGGVSVTFGTTAVSLDSDEGKDASLALAPQLAEKLGGVAHTGGEEPDYTPSGEDAAAEARGDAGAGAGFECLSVADSYQPGTARYGDGSTGYEASCVQPATDEWANSPEKAQLDAANDLAERNAQVDAYNEELNARNDAFVNCMDTYPGEYMDAVESCNAQHPW